MAGLGVQIRTWPDSLDLAGCREDLVSLERLSDRGASEAIRIIRSPEAVGLDLDGVLADVSASYRRAIVPHPPALWCVTAADIEAVKAQGDANNDWVVTRG